MGRGYALKLSSQVSGRTPVDAKVIRNRSNAKPIRYRSKSLNNILKPFRISLLSYSSTFKTPSNTLSRSRLRC